MKKEPRYLLVTGSGASHMLRIARVGMITQRRGDFTAWKHHLFLIWSVKRRGSKVSSSLLRDFLRLYGKCFISKTELTFTPGPKAKYFSCTLSRAEDIPTVNHFYSHHWGYMMCHYLYLPVSLSVPHDRLHNIIVQFKADSETWVRRTRSAHPRVQVRVLFKEIPLKCSWDIIFIRTTWTADQWPWPSTTREVKVLTCAHGEYKHFTRRRTIWRERTSLIPSVWEKWWLKT